MSWLRKDPDRDGNTFSSIELTPADYRNGKLEDFIEDIFGKLSALKTSQDNYFKKLRTSESQWANGARELLSGMGAIAFLLTALAACVRFAPDLLPLFGKDGDKYLLFAALMIYAVMGAIAFYERGTDKTSSYFRHIAATLGIRDLWNTLQFNILKEQAAFDGSDGGPVAEADARNKIIALAEGFVSDLNKISSTEMTDWKAAFLASLKDLNDAAKINSQSIIDGKQSVPTADDAEAPEVDITLTGDFAGTATILVAGEAVDSTEDKSLVWKPDAPGSYALSAKAANNGTPVEGSVTVDAKAGRQAVTIELK
jgi:hypothetical protein